MPYALITGASSGLGEKFARLCAEDNIPLVLIARREDRLKALATELKNKYKIDVHVFAQDLAQTSAAQNIFNYTESQKIKVGILINNAGFGLLGTFQSLNQKKQLEMIDLNVRSLVDLTQLYLPQMLERKTGKILNIGSTAGFQPGPFMATYYATKAFVNSFSEALSEELKSSGVSVTLSCPGPTSTEFGDTAGATNSKLFNNVNMSAEDVALSAYQAMTNGKRRVIHGLGNSILARLAGFSPQALNLKIVSKLNLKA